MIGLSEGAAAPDFQVPVDGERGSVALAQLRGQAVVLYFYPKDDTSGCTTEARDFSSLMADFAAAGATVVGISPDSTASHAKFRAKHGLSVTLAADEDKAIASAYGVWVEKSMYGRKYMGVERATFLIDRQGVITHIWRNVKVNGHAAEVLKAVEAL